MSKQELLEKLIQDKIPTTVFSLDGGFPNEAYCLNSLHNKWEIYYSERGLKSELKIFATEASACEYFYSFVVAGVASTNAAMSHRAIL